MFPKNMAFELVEFCGSKALRWIQRQMADPVKDLLERAAKRAERVALMDTCDVNDEDEETRTSTTGCVCKYAQIVIWHHLGFDGHDFLKKIFSSFV